MAIFSASTGQTGRTAGTAPLDVSPSWTATATKEPSPSDAAASASPAKQKSKSVSEREYVPISDTLRLYAGWLLAWYVAIYAFGAYQLTRALPWELSVLEELFFSPLILHFAAASYLFLLLSTVHRLLGRKAIVGAAMWVVGILLYLVFRSYT